MALLFIFDNVVKPLIGLAIDPIKRHVSYPFKYKSNVENLDKKAKKSKGTRDSLQRDVDAERRNGNSIEDEVESWLREADEITERIDGERIVREERTKKKCFGVGFCFPNLKIRYQLCKKAEEEASAVAEHQENKKFHRIAYPTVPQPKLVSGDLSLQSRVSLVKEIMDALRVPDVNTIGVHGVGGVGKSMIVKQVAQQARKEKLFRTVVMATVTHPPDVWKIQGELAGPLGLNFEAEESERCRAARLHDRLKQEETVLVVLDNLWEKIDLQTVGIPLKDSPEEKNKKGCRILLTSRSKDVLLTGMRCQKDFGVDCLTEEEAWGLFKNVAGGNFEDPEVQSVAVDVAKECACLPVAIITVAGALRSKKLSAWQNALQELKRPSIENFTEGVPKGTYSCIALSYNHIDSKELKDLFLLCSLIMGYNASIHNLLKYVMGLGLFPNVISIEEARIRMDALLQKLKETYLLIDNDSNEQFAMHDVVRDVAISIAYRDHHVFAANKEAELDLLHKERQNKAMQIWSRCYVELLEDLKCPQLELLHIFRGDPDPQMRGDIFEGMPKLKVLNLTNFTFSMLPSSLRVLYNLQTLCLDQCVLGDIAVIGELKNLEILSFVRCNIEQLPVEINQLTKLKQLDLSDCFELKVIPQNVISKLSRLEELYMGNSFCQWHPDGSNNARISELQNLTHLSNLDIHIRDPLVMSDDTFCERLQRYRILIGDVWDWDGMYRSLRTLKLKLDTSTNALEHGVQTLLKKTEDLYLLELHGVTNIICELGWEGFPKLKHLHLQNSPDIQHIIDTEEGIQSNPFPMLESLILGNLESLEKIYHGTLKAQSPFAELKTLEVENCHKLKNLMSFSLVQCLKQLQNLKVSFCTNMEEIFVEDEEEFEVKNNAVHVMEFTQLYSVSLQYLPLLRSFCCGGNESWLSQIHLNSLADNMGSGEIIAEDALRSPTPLFNGKIVFPNLVELELYSINVEELWLQGIALSLQNLQRLTIDGCSGLNYIFSFATVKSLLRLKHLLVRDCDSVEEIIYTTDSLNEEEPMSELSFPQLESMELIRLSRLMRFCAGYPINCPLLKRLIIDECYFLKTFASSFESANMTVSKESSHEVDMEENCNNIMQPLFHEKGKPQQDLATPACSIEKSSIVSASATASPIKTVSSQELTSGTATEAACGCSSSMQDDPIVDVETQITLHVQKFPSATEMDVPSQSAASFESLCASIENLINISPVTTSLLTPSSESRESIGANFQTFIDSLALVKKLLMKSPAEVAKSADRLLLLSSLKNLKNCLFLNSQLQEIIQVYIENFDTLVSSHLFDDQKQDWTSSIKFSIKELKTRYEDFTCQTSELSARKEALKKELHEIEEAENRISVNKEGLYADLVSIFVEAAKRQREAKNKASTVDEYWAKFGNLLA